MIVLQCLRGCLLAVSWLELVAERDVKTCVTLSPEAMGFPRPGDPPGPMLPGATEKDLEIRCELALDTPTGERA